MTPSDLDFDSNKQKLKDFLKTQTVLKDYEMNSSVVNVLLDILSSNTFFYAFLNNMIINETNLKTATIRKNVIGRSMSLGYEPKSKKSAKSSLYLEFQTDDFENFIVIPKNSIFTANYNNITHIFRTLEDNVVYRNMTSGTYIIPNLEIVEGKLITNKFVYNSERKSVGFKLENSDIDTDTIKITIIEENSTDIVEFKKYSSIDDFGKNVYYLDFDDDNRPIINFGDDIITNDVSLNAEVTVEYLITSAEKSNGITKFSLTTPVPNATLTYLGVNYESTGGADEESVESIKFNAMKSFSSQDRAVTADDYKSIILRQNPDIEDCYTYGGENLDDPAFGSVYAAIKMRDGLFLTENKKNRIRSKIREKNIIVIDVIPEDPDYIFYNNAITIAYNQLVGNKLIEVIIEEVSQILENYYQSIEKFDEDFSNSIITSDIHNISKGVLSVFVETTIFKKVFVNDTLKKNITIQFNNKLAQVLKSSQFQYEGMDKCFFEYVNGNLGLYRLTDFGASLIKGNFGTVDFETGTIVINNFSTSDLNSLNRDSTGFKFIKFETKLVNDEYIKTKKNQILINDGKTINII